jgi:hypothetical protein
MFRRRVKMRPRCKPVVWKILTLSGEAVTIIAKLIKGNRSE